jgi:cytochrome c oxidase subunit 3
MIIMAAAGFIEPDKQNLRARKFLMWLFIVSSFIFFAGLTSGYIVYTAGDPSRGIKTILPKMFTYSTAVIIVSSIAMHMAYLAGKKLQLQKQKAYLFLTALLGVIFFVLQIQGWKQLVHQEVYFVNPNASQSFIYIFTGAHLAHIFAGVLMVVNALLGAVKRIPQVKNLFRLETTSIFWHFLDILWIYLYVFLLLNQ